MRTSTPKHKLPPPNNWPHKNPTTMQDMTILVTTTTMVRARLSIRETTKRMMTKMMERRLMLKVLRTRILSWS